MQKLMAKLALEEKSGPAEKTALVIKIPAHRGDCCNAAVRKEYRLADCIGPECPCPPRVIAREDCLDDAGDCDCHKQAVRQVEMEATLNAKRYDTAGNSLCTCMEYTSTELQLPERPLAAYKGVNCPSCKKPPQLERPAMDPPLPQQQYMRYGDILTRTPPSACPCSRVKPAIQPEAIVPGSNIQTKVALYDSGLAYQLGREQQGMLEQ
jgi:hypothetical protein